MVKFIIIHHYIVIIRKNITPIGDGNVYLISYRTRYFLIRKNITPIGDGNWLVDHQYIEKSIIE